MDYQLIFTKPAARDLEAIVRYIADENPHAAQAVGWRLVELAESLTTMPHRGAPVRDRAGVRKVIHAPYIVLYRVDESRRMIRVQRFWHAKRDPRNLHTE